MAASVAALFSVCPPTSNSTASSPTSSGGTNIAFPSQQIRNNNNIDELPNRNNSNTNRSGGRRNLSKPGASNPYTNFRPRPVSPINSASTWSESHIRQHQKKLSIYGDASSGNGTSSSSAHLRSSTTRSRRSSGGASSSSTDAGLPVNCICCPSAFVGGGGGGRSRIHWKTYGNGNGSGGTLRVVESSARTSFSLQNLIHFQAAGNRGRIKSKQKRQQVGVMEPAAAARGGGGGGVGVKTASAPSKTAVVAKPIARLQPGDPLPDDYVEDDPTKTGPERRAGILLHPTSLPGSYGIGELGDEALHFLDWLKGAGVTVWQVLPLVPPGRKSGEDGSPYAGQDANCGNTLLISLEELVKWGLLEKTDLPRRLPVNRVDYDAVAKVKDPLLVKAAQKLVASEGGLKQELEKFRKNPSISVWLEEAALFSAIDHSIDAQFWWKWPAALRDRDPKALEDARKEHKQYIDVFVAQQFLFQRQWQAVHKYAREQGIRIIGDMPIYVGGHSADVWAHRSSFMLDEKTGVPSWVSGVPPDAFSATGQLWGSPLYNWKAMAKDNYSWWSMRMKRAFDLYDEFRIDHFRGLAGYWAIKADEETALNGTWQVGPRQAFFDAIQKAVGKIDIIAEDLGVITSDVVELRKAIKAPGMAVLQFAFGSDPQNPHLPHNHEIEAVAYPGTHDNDTVRGWWIKLPEDEKETVRTYLRIKGTAEDISWDFIRATFSSVARTAIIPMQDVLSLDNSARMNTPAVQAGNWGWRVGESGVFTKLEKERDQLRALLKYYNRMPRRTYCPI
ncbi:unnamed protein product [Calypogeia fissa]